MSSHELCLLSANSVSSTFLSRGLSFTLRASHCPVFPKKVRAGMAVPRLVDIDDNTDYFDLDVSRTESKRDAKRDKPAWHSSSQSRLFAPTKSSLAKARGGADGTSSSSEKPRSASERMTYERRPSSIATRSSHITPPASATASPHTSPPASPRASSRRRSDVAENLALRLQRQQQQQQKQKPSSRDVKNDSYDSPAVSPRWSTMGSEARSPRLGPFTGSNRQGTNQICGGVSSQRGSTSSRSGGQSDFGRGKLSDGVESLGSAAQCVSPRHRERVEAKGRVGLGSRSSSSEPRSPRVKSRESEGGAQGDRRAGASSRKSASKTTPDSKVSKLTSTHPFILDIASGHGESLSLGFDNE